MHTWEKPISEAGKQKAVVKHFFRVIMKAVAVSHCLMLYIQLQLVKQVSGLLIAAKGKHSNLMKPLSSA